MKMKVVHAAAAEMAHGANPPALSMGEVGKSLSSEAEVWCALAELQ